MAGKVTAAEKKKAADAVKSTYTADSISNYTNAYNKAISGGATAKEAYATASGLLVKNNASGGTSSSASSGGTSYSGGASSGGVSGNASSGGDIYGDVSKKATTNKAMDFSNYSGDKTLSSANALFGADAAAREKTNSGFITSRNDTIAYELLNNRKNNSGLTNVNDYLSQFDSFRNASDADRENTIRAIEARMAAVEEQDGIRDGSGAGAGEGAGTGEGNGGFDWDKNNSELSDLDGDGAPDKPGYYYENGEYYKILGYDAFTDAEKAQADLMDNKKKKELSNMSAEAQQKALKAADDTLRADEYLNKKKDLDKQQWDNSYEQAQIQMRQTLRHAREGYDNLKQNWQYLGNMGMPGVSATKIEAIGDAIGEAETTLAEIEKLEDLKDKAMKLQWDQQALEYSHKIDDLWNDLKWQTSQEFVDVISKFTAAELEGNLDTIDGITAFRRSLLEDLDSQLSGITSASLQQMQYINQEYQNLADKMEEYVKNQYVVNSDMSAVKGYYIDGNGNPIFNAKGETIEVPQNAPLDPVYDKETGKLIVFGYDENGNITANVQNILGYENPYYTGQGTGLGGMRTERNNNPTAMTTDVARSLGMVEGVDYRKGDSFTTDEGKVLYTAEIIGDPIETTIRAFDNAAAKGIGIFYTKDGAQRWRHTAMSNEQWMAMSDNEKRNTILKMLQREGGDINKMAFYNQGGSVGGGANEYGFDPTKTGYYDKYLQGKFTTQDWKEIGNEDTFQQEIENYKNWVDSQVATSSADILRSLYDLQNMSGWEFNAAWMNIPKSSGRSKRKAFENYISNVTLNKLIDAKKNGATFGALSDAELGILQNAATRLDFGVSQEDFDEELNRLIAEMEEELLKHGRQDVIDKAKSGETSDNYREEVQSDSGL